MVICGTSEYYTNDSTNCVQIKNQEIIATNCSTFGVGISIEVVDIPKIKEYYPFVKIANTLKKYCFVRKPRFILAINNC